MFEWDLIVIKWMMNGIYHLVMCYIAIANGLGLSNQSDPESWPLTIGPLPCFFVGLIAGNGKTMAFVGGECWKRKFSSIC